MCRLSTPTPNAAAAAAVNIPATGDEVTPPFKKRLLSRSASGKTQTPGASPSQANHQSQPSAAAASTLTETRNKRGQQQLNSNTIRSTPPSAASASPPSAAAAAVVASSSPSSSVHTLFATNFFNNVSTGYNVLMHTFQYLKVQELLRASCVCRMWNQAAQNSLLWRTVRMKNSPVG